MRPAAIIEASPTCRACHQAQLDEIRLDHFFDRIARLGQAGSQRFHTNRAAFVDISDHPQVSPILRIQTKGMPLAGDVDLAEIAHRTHGYTGADLGDVVRRAGLSALRQDLGTPTIRQAEFEKALSESRASVTAEMEQQYEELRTSLKRQAPIQRRRIGFDIDGT